ncbi:cyclase family protein [Bordetella genomosp. 9]|uniref:Cyclase n=1 Tax=Bordetella genomosp. 9 TaxID=1416803 RepID=A0A1W6Z1B6_9BORD|nr:cyclase family protein [Bordetella genomosp. 9]ARP87172.1 cyclase [Bordetella genomosp. 9]ARP91158.1 cyclase [Bordetella genomosp. 9]
MQRWKCRPEGSTWGDYGPDDELGRLNLLTEEKVLQGVREVRAGKVFCLSLPLDLPGGNVLNPRRRPPLLGPVSRDGRPTVNFPLRREDASAIDVLNDDQVTLTLQYSTQWDALSHVGALFDLHGDGSPRLAYYNGFEGGVDILGGEDAAPGGGAHADAAAACCPPGGSYARRLGIDTYARKGMQGRGVMVDLAHALGTRRTLVDETTLAEVMRDQNVTVEAGDMLVLRTGFAEAIVRMDGRPDLKELDQTGAVLDGADTALLDWITRSGIAAICTDNYAVEAYPAMTSGPVRSVLPLHHHCLFKLGVPLAELWYLKDLAEWLREHGRTRFLLTAPPLRLPGAMGSPVTPVATV